jgi:ribosomal-protein-serine acetyltransferase
MSDPILISTERPDVVLRQFVPQDAESLFSLIDRNRTHLSQFGDETSAKYPDEKSVLLSITNNPRPDKLRFGVWWNEQLTGTANLKPDWHYPGGYIGYWIGTQYTGKGLATTATRALVDYAFKTLGWHGVLARAHRDNEASHKVLRRAGLRPYLTLDEECCFQILDH